MWLEGTISYWGDDEESFSPKRKLFKNVILVQAVSYTDAEEQLTRWAVDELLEDEFEIRPIKELDIEEVIRNKTKGFFYKCDCTWNEIDERGKTKEYKRNILVEASDSSVASKIAFKKMQDWTMTDEPQVKKVAQTQILHVLSWEDENDLPY